MKKVSALKVLLVSTLMNQSLCAQIPGEDDFWKTISMSSHASLSEWPPLSENDPNLIIECSASLDQEIKSPSMKNLECETLKSIKNQNTFKLLLSTSNKDLWSFIADSFPLSQAVNEALIHYMETTDLPSLLHISTGHTQAYITQIVDIKESYDKRIAALFRAFKKEAAPNILSNQIQPFKDFPKDLKDGPSIKLNVYRRFVIDFGHNAAVMREIESVLPCDQYPHLTAITLNKGVWDMGCAYGMMSQVHDVLKVTLDYAEAHCKDPIYGLTSISEEGKETDKAGYYSFNGIIQSDQLYHFDTIIHELTHYVMDARYKNYANPYKANDKDLMIKMSYQTAQTLLNLHKLVFPNALFRNIDHNIMAHVFQLNATYEQLKTFNQFRQKITQANIGHLSSSQKILAQRFQNLLRHPYPPDQYNREAIVLYPELLRHASLNQNDMMNVIGPIKNYWDTYFQIDLSSQPRE